MSGIRVACFGFSTLLGGCALHPLPEDFSRAYTIEIAHSIRCEARDAYKMALAETLMDRKDNGTRSGGAPTFDEETVNIGQKLQGNTIDLSDFGPSTDKRAQISAAARDIVEKLDKGSIGLDFTLNMKEENNLNLETNMKDLLLPGVLNIKTNLKNDRSRENERRFKIVDSFSEYYDPRIRKKCGEKVSDNRQLRNYLYPMTGKIGLEELVRTHTILTDSASLDGFNDDQAELSDTLTFITVVGSDVSPTIFLEPQSAGFNVTSVAPMLGVTRTDQHKVVVQLVAYKAPKGKASVDASPGKTTVVAKETPTETRVEQLLLERRRLDAFSLDGELRDR